MEQCRKDGIAEGITQGIDQGKHQQALAMAEIMLKKGFTPEIIAECTNLTIEEIAALTK